MLPDESVLQDEIQRMIDWMVESPDVVTEYAAASLLPLCTTLT